MSGQIDLDIVKLFGLGLSLQKHEQVQHRIVTYMLAAT